MEEKYIPEVKKLLKESTEIHYEIIKLFDEMNDVAKTTAKSTKIPKWMFNKMKDCQYYKGLGWEGGKDPLNLDSNEKFKDRMSPVFIRLLNLVQLCRHFNNLDLIKEYIEALKSFGINITIEATHDSAPVFSPEAIKVAQATIDKMIEYQSQICKLADILRDENSLKAESYDYVPKAEFRGIVDTNYRKQVDKVKYDSIKKRLKGFYQVEEAINNILEDDKM